MGGLQSDEQCSRFARFGRSKLLRPWRQSPWRLGTDARSHRRLFVIPYTIGNYLAGELNKKRPQTSDPAFQQTEKEVRERVQRLLSINGSRTVDSFHREVGLLMWDKCGMAREKAGLEEAIARLPKLREEFWSNLKVLGAGENINHSLEKAGRVADFLEFGDLMCRDALDRNESCGGHFRLDYEFRTARHAR